MTTIIAKIKDNHRVDSVQYRDIALRNGKDIRDAILSNWGIVAERDPVFSHTYRGNGFAFNVYYVTGEARRSVTPPKL